MKHPRCRYDADLGWLTPEHVRDCNTAACAGCKPCPKTHCAMRGRCASHVEPATGIITCPSCVGRVRADLSAIEDLATTVEYEAYAVGIDSEAFSLAGPAPQPSTREVRNRWIRSVDHKRGWCNWPNRIEDDPHHPYAVLGRWDMALREQYGPPTALLVTVSRAADYLRGLLAGEFPHGDEFEEFAADIARCRAHLETVIHDSRTPELGAPCPKCIDEHGKGARLRKRYASHPGLPHGMRCAAPEGKCAICTGRDDTWHCPDEPAHWWTEADYRLRVAEYHHRYADALTAADMAEEYGIKPGTLRKRAERDPKMRRGRNQFGQQLYDVARALAADGA